MQRYVSRCKYCKLFAPQRGAWKMICALWCCIMLYKARYSLFAWILCPHFSHESNTCILVSLKVISWPRWAGVLFCFCSALLMMALPPSPQQSFSDDSSLKTWQRADSTVCVLSNDLVGYLFFSPSVNAHISLSPRLCNWVSGPTTESDTRRKILSALGKN